MPRENSLIARERFLDKDLFFSLVKSKLDLLLCQRQHITVDDLNHSTDKRVSVIVARVDCDLHLTVNCFFVRRRVYVRFFQKDQFHATPEKFFIDLKTFIISLT